MTITLFIIEHQPAVGIGLELLLSVEPDLFALGVALNCACAFSRIAMLRPQVVIVDIDCPRIQQGESTPALRLISARAALICLTLFDNNETCRLAQQVGASAVVLKSSPASALLDAIRQAATSPGRYEVRLLSRSQ